MQEAEAARLKAYGIGGSYTIPTHQVLNIQVQKYNQDIQDVGLRLLLGYDLTNNLQAKNHLNIIEHTKTTFNKKLQELRTKYEIFILLSFSRKLNPYHFN